MAFPTAGGYGNLPNGNFSPVIYSKKVQKALRKASVVEDVTNTDYAGEIANFGDSVKIIKEPDITINDYKRGTSLATQDLTDADFTMVVDEANYFQFAIDDIEEAHSHVNFMDLATDRAAYKLRDAFDQDVLGYIAGFEKDGSGNFVRRSSVSGTKQDTSADNDELLPAHNSDLGVEAEITSVPLAVGGGSSGVTSPLAVLNRIARLMDQQNVDTEGRWVVVDPVFAEILMDEDSKLINGDFGGDGELRNGRMPGTIRGFRIYKSNNLPFIGTGPGTSAGSGSETDFGVLVAGHDSAAATAQQINKTESFRSPDTFADIVRGMQLYGRKILRSEAMFTTAYNIA
jgi:hypothetical protein